MDCDLMDDDKYRLRRGFAAQADSSEIGKYISAEGAEVSQEDARTYTYSVTAGEVVRAYVTEMGQPLGASAAIVSLWNGSTFVETVKRGDIRRPVTTVDVTIPSGVTAVKLCVNISGRYAVELKRITIRGVISPSTMFNERYAQPYMIQANEAYLSGLCNILTPTSVEGNADVVIDGKSVMDAITLTASPLFLPKEVSITTPLNDLTFDWSGQFTLSACGYGYTCYLKDVRIAVGMEQAVTYTLLVKEVGV